MSKEAVVEEYNSAPIDQSEVPVTLNISTTGNYIWKN